MNNIDNIKNQCNTFSHFGLSFEKVYKFKKKYSTLDEAILAARKKNADIRSIHKSVAYKCSICCNYHIGRTNKVITDKERDRYQSLLKVCDGKGRGDGDLGYLKSNYNDESSYNFKRVILSVEDELVLKRNLGIL